MRARRWGRVASRDCPGRTIWKMLGTLWLAQPAMSSSGSSIIRNVRHRKLLNPGFARLSRAAAVLPGVMRGGDGGHHQQVHHQEEQPTNDDIFNLSFLSTPPPPPASSSSSSSLPQMDVQMMMGRIRQVGALSSYQRLLWQLPILAWILAWSTFGPISQAFHQVVQSASHDTWIPDTEQHVEIQQSLILEVHWLRQLQQLLNSATALACLTPSARNQAMELVQAHAESLTLWDSSHRVQQQPRNQHNRTTTADCYMNNSIDSLHGPMAEEDPHRYMESTLPALLQWCRQQESQVNGFRQHTITRLVAEVATMAQAMIRQRSQRWMALRAVHFPVVHYVTLALLAGGICVSFLVATAQAEFIFLRGLPVRILWSVLVTSFTALGVVCFDLSRPFGGEYQVSLR